MRRTNNTIIILSALLFTALIWYLFIKQDDYIIRFQAKTSPGTIMTSVEEWNLLNEKEKLFSYHIKKKLPYESLSQSLVKNKQILDIQWEFESVNDSVTKVQVGLSEKKSSIFNRLTVPFASTAFKSEVIDLIKDYKTGLDHFIKEKFRVPNLSIDSIPGSYYAYVSLRGIKMRDKASQMLANNGFILAFLTANGIEKDGYPIIQVDHWDKTENTIDFKFGFPIKKVDSLPHHPEIAFGRIEPGKAVKAIYNGNYIYSDRAWFQIDEYSKRHGIHIDPKPIEVFYDNPFMGGNELDWVAEVYMPLK